MEFYFQLDSPAILPGDVIRVIDDIAEVHRLQMASRGWEDDMALVRSLTVLLQQRSKNLSNLVALQFRLPTPVPFSICPFTCINQLHSFLFLRHAHRKGPENGRVNEIGNVL